MKPAWYILKRGQELRNSLAGGTGKTLFGAATTVLDKRNSKRSIGIMIFLMEAVLASIFWLEDAPINTSNTIYVTYTLRKAYHILVWFGSAFAHYALNFQSIKSKTDKVRKASRYAPLHKLLYGINFLHWSNFMVSSEKNFSPHHHHPWNFMVSSCPILNCCEKIFTLKIHRTPMAWIYALESILYDVFLIN